MICHVSKMLHHEVWGACPRRSATRKQSHNSRLLSGTVPRIMEKVKIMKTKEAKSSLIIAHMGIDLESPRESTKTLGI